MSVQNAFTIGLSYARAPAAQTCESEQKNTRWKEDRWKWSIMTTDDKVRKEVMKRLAKVKGDGYGPSTRYFADRDVGVIDVPFEVVKKLFESSHSDFIVFNKISEGLQWSISKNYTKGDLTAYFGARFQGTYQTTGKKKPPHKVR